jgi:hypothetical protein
MALLAPNGVPFKRVCDDDRVGAAQVGSGSRHLQGSARRHLHHPPARSRLAAR